MHNFKFLSIGLIFLSGLLVGLVSEPAMANQYGFTSIANEYESGERQYSRTRGWDVHSATLDGQFSYCFAEKSFGGTRSRIGTDGGQWQYAVEFLNGPPFIKQAIFEVDGRRISTSAHSDGSWTFFWLGMAEVDTLKRGNTVIFDIGRASMDFSLSGSTAAILKVQECMTTRGDRRKAVAPKPKPMPIESDAHRLAGNCPVLGVSANGHGPATVEFIDTKSSMGPALTLYWVDFNGNPTEMGIFLDGPIRLDSSASHRFIAKDFSGTCFGGMMITRPGHNVFTVR